MSTEFRYWGPKFKKPRIFPSDLKEITTNNFTGINTLDTDWDITDAELVRALYETGYGKRTNWADFLSFDAQKQEDLFVFLTLRKDWLLSALSVTNGAVVVRSFADRLETSEWGSMSYYLGQAGARISADRWLAPARKVVRALHNSLYTNEAFLKRGALMQVVTRGEKTPDLLVEDDKGDWHVFEAKGGAVSYRSEAVTKGLAQLDSIIGVGMGYTCNPPKSSVCSFTVLKRPPRHGTSQLSFDVVDPPTEPPAHSENELQDADPPNGSELYILPDVAELRSAAFNGRLVQRRPIANAIPGHRRRQHIVHEGPLPGVYIVGNTGIRQSVERRLALFDAIRAHLSNSEVNGEGDVFASKQVFLQMLSLVREQLGPLAATVEVQAALNDIDRTYEVTSDASSPEYSLLVNIAEALDFKGDVQELRKRREQSVEAAYELFPDAVEAVLPGLFGGVFVQIRNVLKGER
ncbi:hypothetical protein [Burkholderia aenigmatica]|uniref:hypothetical protein n=1 Tax=Burkholderia aenigmatica TaxID=2015348 RepID=UPI002650C802|nr:hypothetical protein [Burkholderia aenigmatica]MDN7874834.1 hypothetical protein [Burkholderia aenigmatica]